MTPFLYWPKSDSSIFTQRVTSLLILALLLGACSKPKSEYQNLSEKPALSIIPYSNHVNESVIQTRLSIPLDQLQARLEEDIPEYIYNDPGKIKQKCIRIFGKNLCEAYQIGGWAQRTGPIQLIPLRNGFLRISIPVRYKLKVQGKGKVVKELLRNIDFRAASFTVIADLQPRINSNWQLQLAAKSTIQWNESPAVKVLGVDIDIQSKIEKPIQKALDKALLKQQQKMARDNRFRQRVEAFWHTLQQPRKLKGPFPLWLKANPSAINLSTIRIDANLIQVDMSLRTTLLTSGTPENLNDQPSPLPPLVQQTPYNSGISISMPLAIAYRDLADNLQEQIKSQPLVFKQGKSSVTVKSIEIYPNNDRLVLAAKVRLSGLAGLLTSDGEIFISGKPVIDNQEKVLKLADVAFSRQLDSVFWNTATRLMQDKLLSGLQNSLIYDFSQRYDALHQSINQQLQDHKNEKLKLSGQLYGLQIKHIEPDLEELRLIVDAQGEVTLELTTL